MLYHIIHNRHIIYYMAYNIFPAAKLLYSSNQKIRVVPKQKNKQHESTGCESFIKLFWKDISAGDTF